MRTNTPREARFLYQKLEIHNNRPLSIYLIASPPSVSRSHTVYVVPARKTNELPLSNSYPTLNNIALQLLEIGHVPGRLLPVHHSSPSLVRGESTKVRKLSWSIGSTASALEGCQISTVVSKLHFTLSSLAHLLRTYPRST